MLEWTDEQIEDLINRVYGGVVTANALPRDLYEAILDRFTDAIIEGFGDFTTDEAERVFDSFTDHVKDFSFAKVFQEINDFENFIFDADGNKVAFSEFKKVAREIFDIYNVTWLETEYNTAVSATQSAKNFLKYQEDKEALPLLKYQTVGDERVRNSHKKLDGIVKHVDDPFWDKYLSPNDFNCRCFEIQLEDGEEPETDTTNLKFEEVKPLFRNNPAKSGEIFKRDFHPYFNGLGDRKNAF